MKDCIIDDVICGDKNETLDTLCKLFGVTRVEIDKARALPPIVNVPIAEQMFNCAD